MPEETEPPTPRASGASQTAHCGIVLHPATHTRSPAMHRAAYAALGIDADYEAFDVEPDDLAVAMDRFRSEGFRQLAVSIPHKVAMLGFVDVVDPVARVIGAINTVTLEGDRLVGTNTDWIGALRAIERETPIAGRRAVVLGAGGTARALIYGLRERGAEVHVLNRTVARAAQLAEELGADSAGPLEGLADLAPEILVNTTVVGLDEDRSPVPLGALHEGLIVLDAVYSPEVTRLLSDTHAAGGRPIGGKWMLVYQAIEQLQRWTALLDAPPPISAFDGIEEIMAQAFDDAGRKG